MTHEVPEKKPLTPQSKVTAAGVSAAAATLIIFIAGLFEVDVPQTVAAAFVTVVAFIAGYIKK